MSGAVVAAAVAAVSTAAVTATATTSAPAAATSISAMATAAPATITSTSTSTICSAATTAPPILGISTGYARQAVGNQYGGRRQNCADGHCEHELFNVHIVLRLCGFVGNVKVCCCRDRTRSRSQ